MKIVVDTNVLISGVFFGGFPRQVLRGIVDKKISAFATTAIVDEYEEIIQEMISMKKREMCYIFSNRTIVLINNRFRDER